MGVIRLSRTSVIALASLVPGRMVRNFTMAKVPPPRPVLLAMKNGAFRSPSQTRTAMPARSGDSRINKTAANTLLINSSLYGDVAEIRPVCPDILPETRQENGL